MTHTVPDPEPGDYPTELDPQEVRLPKDHAESGDEPDSDTDAPAEVVEGSDEP